MGSSPTTRTKFEKQEMLIPYRFNKYQVFSRFVPDINEKTVLDFGCNYGLFLDTSDGMFPVENYTGVDVSESALEFGKKLFPEAKFIHYNAFNPEYNPYGDKSLPIIDATYDLIIVHSVFTHTSKDEMLGIISHLKSLLNPGGKMIISWTGYANETQHRGHENLLRFFPEHKSLDYCYTIQYYDDSGKAQTILSQEFPTKAVHSVWSFYNIEYFKNLLVEYSPQHIITDKMLQNISIISN